MRPMIVKLSVFDRLLAIAPMVKFSRLTAKRRHRSMRMPDGRVFHTLDELARYIAAQEGLHPSAVWKRYSKYKEYDFLGVAQVRSDCGKSQFFAKHRAIARYLKRMQLNGKSAVAIHRMLKCKFPLKVPHINTLRSYLKSLHIATRRRDARGKKGA
jgi:hypothetical protein